MILAALIFAAVVVSLWRASSVKRPAPQPAPPSQQDRELAHLRRRYVADELSVDEFERRVEDALDPKRPRHTEHVEVHIWGDPPPGHALHLHL